MNLKAKQAQINDMIKGQERRIEKAQARIIELKEQLFDLDKMPPVVQAQPIPVVKDDHNYCGKILYPSKKAANSARRLINRDLIKMGKPPMRRSYLCNQCDAWHLTTVPHWSPYPENENNQLVNV